MSGRTLGRPRLSAPLAGDLKRLGDKVSSSVGFVMATIVTGICVSFVIAIFSLSLAFMMFLAFVGGCMGVTSFAKDRWHNRRISPRYPHN
jgi:hypothetical protein